MVAVTDRHSAYFALNFLENPAIPPDNNASERGIRKVKIKSLVLSTDNCYMAIAEKLRRV